MIPLQKLNRRIIDLKASKVDKTKSKPAEGKYIFGAEKVYYAKKSRPPFILKWCVRPSVDSKNPGVPLVESWKYQYGFDFVKAGDYDYWVEGLTPDGDGHFVHGDAVLMKIPTEAYVTKVKEERDEHKNKLRGNVRGFRNRMKQQKADIKDDVLSDIMGGIDIEPQ